MSTDDGATKTPDDGTTSECMGRWKHQWKWVWVGQQWTNRQVCGTCGDEREVERGDGQ